jgi:lauroyl/myristoyl acyltransferase
MNDDTATDKQTLVPAVGAQVERGVSQHPERWHYERKA